MSTASVPAPRLYHFAAAFGAGGLLTLMILFNGTLAVHGSLFFASWVPHLTGTFAALLLLLILRPKRVSATRPPLWAYLGGVSGGVTVMLTSATMNTALALSGTIALGLAGQVFFSLFADMRGLFGLPKRLPSARDYAALSLILTGSLILIFFGGSA
ncbi:DMT family transporter [Cognatiyoonia sp. IB215182]|uniref:DMT family transporter n=1 Tax=Cognatiyoonia sp. IB215182 TaxID=3097353 RepID=UPI002A172DAD|nr:DMT family transporter [Cognatiyoonia sp. IB215182]MDX8353817.1 DMT family transporter [Cognatiyoonia sp. IB215182]